ncbi:MAG: hypothetical protein M1828_001174 [Chrysothrix sp. TS-e1954]|nr:MAG: hypothetical protein M1828_001174 [Chrysothrix sp. TS-e1954]
MASLPRREPRPSFLVRAADILRPGKRGRSGSKLSTVPEKGSLPVGWNEKAGLDGTGSSDSNGKCLHLAKGKGKDEEEDRRRYARTVPPWVQSLNLDEDDADFDSSSTLLPSGTALSRPSFVRTPHRNFMPMPKERAAANRRNDRERSDEPVVMRNAFSQHASRWQSYAKASEYGRPAGEKSRVVDEEWLKSECPDLDKPWNVNGERQTSNDKRFWLFDAEKRRSKGDRFHFTLMSNAFIPLLIRTIVLLFVAAALALGAWIYHESDKLNQDPTQRAGTSAPPRSNTDYVCQQQTSTYMAFIVDSCAIVYLTYITWDEYTSEPLGRRRGRDKMRLLYLDLLFIVFSSANLSLAFNTLTDQQWSCYGSGQNTSNNNNVAAATTTCVQSDSLCRRQGALCGVLICALSAWLITFAISVMRIVEKISR